MIFNTLQFLPFIALVILVHYTIPWRSDKVFLLLASLIFYASFDPPFVLVLLWQSIADYYLARFIVAEDRPRVRKAWLIVSLVSNLGLLGFFKYSDFIGENLNTLLGLVGVELRFPGLGLVLPVGISFYTFQTLSYTIDVYRGKLKPAPFIDFMLFVCLFTQLVAGPIVRATHFLPQLARRTRRVPSFRMVGLGAWLVLLGFTKKIVFADGVATYVGGVFKNPAVFSVQDQAMALLSFSWQIYCDFSGYSDIAIGLCLLMGFHLKRNFNLPYLAQGFSDFWRRWHISLSSWIRDYMYIPIGGSRKGDVRTVFNLLVTMGLCGLWHGASWMFIIWGVAHGLCLWAERVYVSFMDRSDWRLGPIAVRRDVLAYKVLSVAVTFFLVSCLWAFFRADSVPDALTILWAFVKLPGLVLTGHLGMWRDEWTYIAVLMALHVVLLLRRHFRPNKVPHWTFSGLAGAVMLFLLTVSWESNNVFIYFQF